ASARTRLFDAGLSELERLVVGERAVDQSVEHRIAETLPPEMLDLDRVRRGKRKLARRRLLVPQLVPGERRCDARALRAQRIGAGGKRRSRHQQGERPFRRAHSAATGTGAVAPPLMRFSTLRSST